MISDLQHQLGIDSTFFTQLLIFLGIFLWLQIVFFKPYLALVQKREGQSGGLSDEAAKLEEAADRAEKEYKEAFSAARKRVMAERERILGDARKGASDLLASARLQSKTKLEKARETATQSSNSELASLKSQVGGLAQMLVEKLTKTRVGL